MIYNDCDDFSESPSIQLALDIFGKSPYPPKKIPLTPKGGTIDQARK